MCIMVLTNCASCLWMWSQWECFFKQQLSTITLEEDLFLSFWDADKGCPLPLKYFILPQVKVSITWQKGKLFVWFLASGRFSNQVGSSDVEIYTLHIQNSMSERERGTETTPLISWKCNSYSIKKGCRTFPPAFWKSKSESTKSLSVCIINACIVKELSKNMPWIQIFFGLHAKQKPNILTILSLKFTNVYNVHNCILNNNELKSHQAW